MNKQFLITILISLATLISYGTSKFNTSPYGDTITTRKVLGGHQYFHDGKMINMNKLQSILKTDENAYSIFKPAKSSYSIATVLGVAGGALIGWPLGTAIAGRDPEWIMLGAGAVLAGISIPISIKSGKQIKKAVDAYNQSQNSAALSHIKQINIGATSSGVGLVFHF